MEVVACSISDRLLPVEGLQMKVWVGYLNPDLKDTVDFGQEDLNVDHMFEADCVGAALPYAKGLSDAANKQFSFFSASDYVDPLAMKQMEAEALAAEEPEELGLEAVASKVQRLEGLMLEMSELMKMLASKKAAASPKRPPALKTTAKASALSPRPHVQFNPEVKRAQRAQSSLSPGDFPTLGQGVVRAAIQAGLSREVLEQMSKLVGSKSKATRLGDMNPLINADPLSDLDPDERRWWCSSFWGSDAGCTSEAHGHSQQLDGGAQEEGGPVFLGQSLGPCCHRLLRVGIYRLWEKVSCGETEPQSHAAKPTSRVVEPHREVDVGGCLQPDIGSRDVHPSTFGSKLDGAPQPHWCLSRPSSWSLGRCWSSGCIDQWSGTICSSSSVHLDDAIRSERYRCWKLVLSSRAIPRTRTPAHGLGATPRAQHPSGRVTIQSAAGSALGGDFIDAFERSGGFSGSPTQCGQVQPRSEGGRRGDRWRNSQEKAKSEAESQGFARTECMTDEAEMVSFRSRLQSCRREPCDNVRQVPGATATTVTVQTLMNSMPQWILKTKGSLRGFLHSILKADRCVT